jgi:hypothetical protein
LTPSVLGLEAAQEESQGVENGETREKRDFLDGKGVASRISQDYNHGTTGICGRLQPYLLKSH